MQHAQIKTTDGVPISIFSVGQHNLNSGPDFFNAKLSIGTQLWAGNVEVHVKSSDWFLHNHEQDRAYDNVILHVVWEHDTDIYRNDNSAIPTLELKHYVLEHTLNNYKKLISKRDNWINCEQDFASIDTFIISNWLERLYFERLERKTEIINTLLKDSKNDWEATLFKMLAKSFGLKVNSEAFLSMASSFDFSILRKIQNSPKGVEALFFGQSGLLEQDIQDTYVLTLQEEYRFLKQKFSLHNENHLVMQFFRLRPPNFPTIRLSQLATLYLKNQNLVSKIIEIHSLEGFYALFSVGPSDYWETHYTFGKPSKPSKKLLTEAFINLLLINTILPFKFCYAKFQNQNNDDTIIKLITNIASEKNSIVEKFNALRPISNAALQSQGLLELKNEYCDKNKCLQCAIGSSLLQSK